jgi:ABC-type dipeptide/oligopeptide/nickel transport system ATPase component
MDSTTTDSIVTVEDLRITSPDDTVLVDSVSFTVPRGGSLGLVGESGSGKSLSALAIIQLLPLGLHATGSVRLEGTEVLGADVSSMRKKRGRKVAMVFQDPFTALNPVFTIRTQLYEVIRTHATKRLSSADVRRLALEALADVGLSDPARFLDRYPFQLSGGQAQRVAIALALVPEPELLIADEPTTALDVTVQDGILRLLERLRESRKLSLLFISHDLAVVARLCRQLCIMQNGLVVEAGPTDEILRNPRADYTRLLLDSVADFSALGAPAKVKP